MENLVNFVIAFIVSFYSTSLIVPFMRFVALKLAIIDKRDPRKLHRKVITRIGGLAIYIGFIYATAAVLFTTNLTPIDKMYFHKLSVIFIASTMILFLGLYDDIMGAKPYQKIMVQLFAAVILIRNDLFVAYLSNPFGNEAAFVGIWGIPITLLWVVGLTNAINLIDGVDGLAGSIVFICSIGLFVKFIISDMFIPGIISISLAGACLGFLRYNTPPAKIHMGDTGSMFLGFLLAAFSLQTSHKSATAVTLMVPLLMLLIPISDTILAVFRRLLRGQHPFIADKHHLHHWLLSKDLSYMQVVLILCGTTFILNVLVIVSSFLKLVK
ncbi:MAG: undecaprenyl/decaprenyl-phosphate alpha-N-acetylglucosaminyl 1-phosphate transferase [Candidatus Omnitrophica bacterium]|nr:undecaprenyl/decaprenyl-phosphate alpha-N-acetylglucosaminyl 1-phosphate transferase [Candidatus Omnitrophota bacterium]